MKRIQQILPLFILCFIGTSSLFAQMTDGKARLGFKVGLNGSNLYDDATATEKKSRTGITGGVFAQIPLLKNRFAIRPELLFTTKGGGYNIANEYRPDFKTNYVELPIAIEYRLLGFINLHAGGYAARLVSANGTSIFKGDQGGLSRANFEKYDYGWLVGTGIDFGGLGLHFRISRGLQKIGSPLVAPLFGDLKNATWALTLSYGL